LSKKERTGNYLNILHDNSASVGNVTETYGKK